MSGNEPCPHCPFGYLHYGYGLAGGGIGPYTYCDTCEYFDKVQDPECGNKELCAHVRVVPRRYSGLVSPLQELVSKLFTGWPSAISKVMKELHMYGKERDISHRAQEALGGGLGAGSPLAGAVAQMQCEVAGRQPQLPMQIGRLQDKVDDLEKAFAELEARLQPLSRQHPPAAGQGVDTAKIPEPQVAAAAAIQASVRRLQALHARICDQLARLEA